MTWSIRSDSEPGASLVKPRHGELRSSVASRAIRVMVEGYPGIWLLSHAKYGGSDSRPAVSQSWEARLKLAALLLRGGRLTLELDQDQLEGLVAGILRQVLATGLPLRRPGLHGGVLSLTIGQREPCLAVRQKHRHTSRVLVHHRLLVGAIGDPKDPDLVILKLYLVMLGIDLHGVLRRPWCRQHNQGTRHHPQPRLPHLASRYCHGRLSGIRGRTGGGIIPSSATTRDPSTSASPPDSATATGSFTCRRPRRTASRDSARSPPPWRAGRPAYRPGSARASVCRARSPARSGSLPVVSGGCRGTGRP